MSRWAEQFKNHEIHTILKQLLEWVDVEESEIPEESIEEVRRANKILRAYKSAIEKIEPETMCFPQLDSLNSTFKNGQIWNQLQGFSSDFGVAQIVRANDSLSESLHFLWWLAPNSENFQRIDSLQSLEETSDAVLKSLTSIKNKLKDDIKALESKVVDLSGQAEKMDSAMESRRTEVSQQMSQWQQQFSDAQESRSKNFSDYRSNLESETSKRVDGFIDSSKDKLDEYRLTFEQNIEELEHDAESKHQRILELYELASGDSIAGGYSQSSAQEEKQANWWRLVSVGFILGTVLWLFIAYNNFSTAINNKLTEPAPVGMSSSTPQIWNWQRLLVSFSLTGAMLFGAGYAGQQSNRHREEAKKSRRFALQIKALDPYISSLPKDVQGEIKKTLTEKFFNGADMQSDEKEHLNEKSVNVIVKAVTDILKAKG